MSRREAREHAFKFLYQTAFRNDDVAMQLDMYKSLYPMEPTDNAFFDEVVRGVLDQRDSLDAAISPLLKGWSINRLFKIDLILLRVACYEILHRTDIPAGVSISEAVILAKRYGTDESRAYINAILGKIEQREAHE